MEPETAIDLVAQKRLLQGLGFGFVEEPLPEVAGAPASATPRPEARRPAAPPAREAPRSAPAPADREEPLGDPIPPAERAEAMAKVSGYIPTCKRCPLHFSRGHALPGAGSLTARVLFALEIPGADDDAAGQLLSGEIGTLFWGIVNAMKLAREDVYATSATRCRPIAGRAPAAAEVAACRPFLAREIEIVRPAAIVSFGVVPIQSLLPEAARGGINALRGRWLDYRGIPLMATFALPYIHQNKPRKKTVWEDLQQVMARLG